MRRRQGWPAGYAIVVLVLALLAPAANAGWQKGSIQLESKPITEYHCAPAGSQPSPAVILLHGWAPQGAADQEFERMCSDLAARGYYTEFIEYYSATGAPRFGNMVAMVRDYPVWLQEIQAGVSALEKNPAVDSKRIGLVGFSMGAYLALSIGATYSSEIAAIVEYYGGLSPTYVPLVSNMPPMLILHGEQDEIVPVSNARELDQLLTKAKRPHEMHLYPGANHAFNFQ